MSIIKIKQNKKITKAITTGLSKLNNYSSTNTLHQSFINTIKQLYISRDIRTLTTATRALDLLKSEDTNKFQAILATNESYRNQDR